jgi:hypothetical protein
MRFVIGRERLDLSEHDIGTLRRAEDLRRRFDAGIGPRVGGQFSHFRRMERLGLLEFDGWGRDVDGEVDRDVLVYQLTELGRQVLSAVGAAIRNTGDAGGRHG